MKKYYPIMLDVSNRQCVVVGGGEVAERKASSLLDYGAKVTVISPNITEGLGDCYKKDQIKWLKRPYLTGDLKGFSLAFVATDDSEVNKICFEEAKREGILINIVDQPKMCEFIVPAIINKGALTVAVSTDGKSPMLAKKIKEEIEALLEYISEEYLEALGEIRSIILKEVHDINKRKKLFTKMVNSDLPKTSSPGESKKNIREALLEIYRKEKEK